MEKILARPADNLEEIMNIYGNTLFRICLITLGNTSDAEDAVQETLIKYLQTQPVFNDTEHEKAWLITVATNKCRDILRYEKRHTMVNIEEIRELSKETDDTGILEILMNLQEKYRVILILYYVEGYKISEISHMIGKTTSAVKMRLQKGRRLLAEAYRKEYE